MRFLLSGMRPTNWIFRNQNCREWGDGRYCGPTGDDMYCRCGCSALDDHCRFHEDAWLVNELRKGGMEI